MRLWALLLVAPCLLASTAVAQDDDDEGRLAAARRRVSRALASGRATGSEAIRAASDACASDLGTDCVAALQELDPLLRRAVEEYLVARVAVTGADPSRCVLEETVRAARTRDALEELARVDPVPACSDPAAVRAIDAAREDEAPSVMRMRSILARLPPRRLGWSGRACTGAVGCQLGRALWESTATATLNCDRLETFPSVVWEACPTRRIDILQTVVDDLIGYGDHVRLAEIVEEAEDEPGDTPPSYQHALAEAHLALGHTEQALDALDRWEAVLGAEDPLPVHLLRARATVLLGREHGDAIAALERALASSGPSDAADEARAFLAERAVLNALESDPERARTLLAAVDRHPAIGTLQAARWALLDLRVSLVGRAPSTADLLRRGQELIVAIEQLRAAEVTPDLDGWRAYLDAASEIARLLVAEGRPGRAEAWMTDVVAAFDRVADQLAHSPAASGPAARALAAAQVRALATRAALRVTLREPSLAIADVTAANGLAAPVMRGLDARGHASFAAQTKSLADTAFLILRAAPDDPDAQAAALAVLFDRRGRELASDARGWPGDWSAFVAGDGAACDQRNAPGSSLRGCLATREIDMLALVGSAGLPSVLREPPVYVALIVEPHGIRLVELGDAAEIDRHVAAFTRDAADPLVDSRPAGRVAYDRVLGPMLARSGARRVALSLPLALAGAPWDAAETATGTLVLNALDELRRLPAPIALLDPENFDRGHGVLAMADPVGIDRTRPSERRARSGRTFGQLPGASREVRHAQRSLDATVLSGSDGTVRRIRGELRQERRPWLAHFATHGVASGEPFLLVSPSGAGSAPADDARLTAREIVRELRPAPPVVVLSACDTGSGESLASPTINGLREAFLMAGSGAVVSTLWSVDDEASASLMERFDDELAAGADPSGALRTALRETRRSHAHPYYWAGFVMDGIVEEGRMDDEEREER